MCVTLDQAKLSNTIVYAHRITRDGEEIHVLGYENRAASKGPNAMILPLPAAAPVGPSNVIDTRPAPWLLRDLDSGCRVRSRSMMLGATKSAGPPVQVFDAGSYTIVLATEPAAIPEALLLVPEAKRPSTPKAGFFEAYGKLYPDWPIAVCCWSGEISAEPMMWWYRPRHPNWLFMPAVDAHDGCPPEPGKVRRDHALIWGCEQGAFKPWTRDPIPESLQPYVAPKLHVLRPSGVEDNGDYWIHNEQPRSIVRGYPGSNLPF